MTAVVTMTVAVMTTVAAVAVAAALAVAVAAALAAAVMTAVSVAILLLCMRRNPLTTAFPADGAAGAAAASATTASFQRRRHKRHAGLPAPAHVWLGWDRAVAAGAEYSYSPFLSLFSLSHLSLSLILEQNHSFVHFPHLISLKLVLLAEKS